MMKMMLGRLAVPRAVPSPAAQPGQIDSVPAEPASTPRVLRNSLLLCPFTIAPFQSLRLVDDEPASADAYRRCGQYTTSDPSKKPPYGPAPQKLLCGNGMGKTAGVCLAKLGEWKEPLERRGTYSIMAAVARGDRPKTPV